MTAVDSPEKILFASTTQAFLQKEVPLSRVRELHARGVSFEPAWWRRAAELGWTALLVPEELGGGSVSGDGVGDLAMVAEQLGKTVAPGPLYPVSTVLAGLVDCADPHSHEETIESLIAGEIVASWAVYEPGQGWAPHEPSVTATATGSGYRIDGVKDRVEAGAHSNLLLVVARTDDGVGQFLVPTDAPGVRHRAAAVDRPGQAICPCAFRWGGRRRRRGHRRRRRAHRPSKPDRASAAMRRGGRHSRTPFSTSPSPGRWIGTPSAGRWRPTKRSNTASPT